MFLSKLTNVFVQIDKCICANWKKKSIWVLTSCQQDCQLVTLECDPFCEDANWLYQPMSLSIIFDRLGTFCHWLSGCPPTDYTIWKRTVEKSQINAPHATWWAYTMQFVTGCQKAGQLIIPLPPQVSCSTIVQLFSMGRANKCLSLLSFFGSIVSHCQYTWFLHFSYICI